MKTVFTKIAIAYFIISFMSTVMATSLIGTLNIAYQSEHYVFNDGDQILGAVFLNKGFTLLPETGLRINLSAPLRDCMDLRETGSIILENNLELDAGFTLSSSGTICGNGYSLILNDNLIIPEMSTLKITSTLIIDGMGYTLFLDNFAQILVDSHSTLTLRNLILVNSNNSTGKPPIAALGADSKICFDNVKTFFRDDFNFDNGSMYFHNDVLWSGDSIFYYRSPQQSFVAPESVLTFDKDTSFYYLPQTIRDDLFVMQAASSSILFDQASFVSSSTGMSINSGSVLFSNGVKVEAATSIVSPMVPFVSKDYGTSINSMCWSPDGNFLAVVGNGAVNPSGGFDNTDEIRIYKLDFSTQSLLVTATSVRYGGTVNGVSWNSDGRHIAICGNYTSAKHGGFTNNETIRVYQYDQANNILTAIAGFCSYSVICLKWDPSGQFLAFGSAKQSTGPSSSDFFNLKVLYFDPNSNGQKLIDYAGIAFGENPWYHPQTYLNSLDWHIAGGYIMAVGASESFRSEIALYKFNRYNSSYSTRLVAKNIISEYYAMSCNHVSWGPDGKYIAVSRQWYGSGVAALRYYTFDPVSGLALYSEPTLDPYLTIGAVQWAPDGVNVAMGGRTSGGAWSLIIGTLNTPMVQTQYYGSGGFNNIAWHPTKNLIAIAGSGPAQFGSNPSSDELQLYQYIEESQELASAIPLSGYISGRVIALKISNNTQYVALGGYSLNNDIYLFRRSKESGQLSVSDTKSYGSTLIRTIQAVDWHPSDKFLAIGGIRDDNANYDQFVIYELINDSLVELTSVPVGPSSPTAGGSQIKSIAWHPTGKFVAIGCYGAQSGWGGFANTDNVRIYSFDGTTLTPVTSYNFGVITALAWSFDGDYLAIGGSASPGFVICRFDNYSSLTKIVDKPYTAGTIGWNMDDEHLLILGGGTLSVCEFTGSDVLLTTTFITNQPIAKWSADGRFIATKDNSGFFNIVSFEDRESLGVVSTKGLMIAPYCCDWSSDGAALVLGGSFSAFSGLNLLAYNINRISNVYKADNNALNISQDVKMKVLAGSNTQIAGVFNYAS